MGSLKTLSVKGEIIKKKKVQGVKKPKSSAHLWLLHFYSTFSDIIVLKKKTVSENILEFSTISILIPDSGVL